MDPMRKRPLKNHRQRRTGGFSITELLLAVVLLGYSIAVIGECAVVSTMGVTSLTTKADSLSSVRSALERVALDIRQARCFGDYYGDGPQRLQFPSLANPVYGTFVPSGGWPSAPWTNPPYKLSPQCLVMQQPMLFLDPANDPLSAQYNPTASQNAINGFPIMLPKNYISSGIPAYDVENLDTVVYQVVADGNRPGEYLLQMIRLPGKPISGLNTSYRQTINPPQTILSGIVGPKPFGASSSDLPVVFSYLQRPNPGQAAHLVRRIPAADNINSIIGVAIDLEVRKSLASASATSAATSSIFGLHQEVTMRSARNMVLYNSSP